MHATQHNTSTVHLGPITLQKSPHSPATNESRIIHLAAQPAGWSYLVENGDTLATLASGSAGSDTEALAAALLFLSEQKFSGSLLIVSDQDFSPVFRPWELLNSLSEAGAAVAFATNLPPAANKARNISTDPATVSRRRFLTGLLMLPAAAALATSRPTTPADDLGQVDVSKLRTPHDSPERRELIAMVERKNHELATLRADLQALYLALVTPAGRNQV